MHACMHDDCDVNLAGNDPPPPIIDDYLFRSNKACSAVPHCIISGTLLVLQCHRTLALQQAPHHHHHLMVTCTMAAVAVYITISSLQQAARDGIELEKQRTQTEPISRT